MFNRQPFNRGRFNRTISSVNSVFLYGGATLKVEAAGNINAVKSFKGSAALNLIVTGKVNYSASLKGYADLFLYADGALIRAHNLEGYAPLALSAEGNIIRYRNLSGDMLLILALNNEGFNTFQYEQISLPGLLIRAGDELIIDTDNQTVTLNGQNVMRFVDRYSEFFRFRPGTNEVTYESAGEGSRADIRILWKDAWL